MAYLVLARRFRPQTFEEVVGQEHVTTTLANAIRTGRVAHAFLFAGARGVGKTTAARILAKALNCVEGPTDRPCGVCDQCVGITQSRAVDVQEIDGASNNSVDDIRTLRESVPYRPSSGRYKIYIVDEVHMLTTSAFNALLKTLEEPPEHVKFVFATTEPHKIPVTILSRCQRYDFRRVPTPLVLDRLREIARAEAVEAEDGALSILAREAEGSMRDALSLLDQALAFDPGRLQALEVARLLGVADRRLMLQLSAALVEGDPAAALRAVDEVTTFGVDLTRFSHDLLRHLRNLVVVAQCPDAPDLVDLPEDERQEIARQVEGRDPAELHRLFLLFSRACEDVARSPYPRLLLEMALARLSALVPMRSIDELASRLEAIAGGRGGTSPRPAPPSGSGGRGRAPAPSAPRPVAEDGTGRQAARGPAPTAPAAGREPRGRGRSGGGDEPPPPEDEDSPGAVEGPAGSEGSEARFEALLRHIESAAPPLFHMLRYAEPVEVSPLRLRILLPPNPFLREEAQNPARLEALRAACRTVLGGEPEIRLEVGEKGGGLLERQHIERAAREQDRRREATEHSSVRAALHEFEGARLHQVKLIEDD